jgi:hypothetical protein
LTFRFFDANNDEKLDIAEFTEAVDPYASQMKEVGSHKFFTYLGRNKPFLAAATTFPRLLICAKQSWIQMKAKAEIKAITKSSGGYDQGEAVTWNHYKAYFTKHPDHGMYREGPIDADGNDFGQIFQSFDANKDDWLDLTEYSALHASRNHAPATWGPEAIEGEVIFIMQNLLDHLPEEEQPKDYRDAKVSMKDALEHTGFFSNHIHHLSREAMHQEL